MQKFPCRFYFYPDNLKYRISVFISVSFKY